MKINWSSHAKLWGHKLIFRLMYSKFFTKFLLSLSDSFRLIGIWGILAQGEGELGKVLFGGSVSWGKCHFYHVFSQDDVSLYFHKVYLGHFRSFKAEKGVKFLPPTKLGKNRHSRVKFLSPNWHFPQLALFAIFCGIEDLSPSTAGKPFISNCFKKIRKWSLEQR